jgi:hypothetical protein
MSTKEDPGKWDCYANLLPNEPYYLLMGRSRLAPLLVRMELMTRRWEITLGLRPNTAEEHAQIAEGFRCLSEMEIFGREWRDAKEHATIAFAADGTPLIGEHARKEKNSTSGANDG